MDLRKMCEKQEQAGISLSAAHSNFPQILTADLKNSNLLHENWYDFKAAQILETILLI